jgi:hypothetical protein
MERQTDAYAADGGNKPCLKFHANLLEKRKHDMIPYKQDKITVISIV